MTKTATNKTLHVPNEITDLVKRAGSPVLADAIAEEVGIRHLTADEYLRRLHRRGDLVRRGPGVFTTPRSGRPTLEPPPLLRRVGSAIRRDLPMTPVVGWATEWLIPYVHNMPTNHWIVIEAPSVALASLADVLARDRLRAVVNPSPRHVADLPRLFPRPIVLWPHGDTYASVARPGLRLPEPERFVVDLYFAVTRRGLPYPENDLATAIGRLIAEHDLNIGTILAYANRRRIFDDIASYLHSLNRIPADVAKTILLLTERARMRDTGQKCTRH